MGSRFASVTILLLGILSTTASAAKLELVAGGGTGGSGAKATEAKLGQVFGVDRDEAGNFYIIEITNRLWKIDPQGVIHAVAGDGQKGKKGDDGPAKDSQLNAPHSIAVHPAGDIYIGDTHNYTVRKVDGKTGVISKVAGTGVKGHTGDGGPAKDATFGGLYCIAADLTFSRLILTDLDHKQIRVVDLKTGIVSLAAGNGQKGVPADGADAKTSPLVDPRAACADAAGNIYILERGGHALRVVDTQGKIRTIAGTGQKGGGGDGGPAKQAQLNGPKHLCIDRDGNILIADTENHVIRKLDLKTGTISRIAGTGQKGAGAPGGDALQTSLSQPHGVFMDKDGSLYISDSMNGRVLKLVK